jgi:hypothetical protein
VVHIKFDEAYINAGRGEPIENGCKGCGKVDPCGHHYADCTLLEPGDILIERGTEREIGVYDVSEYADETTNES